MTSMDPETDYRTASAAVEFALRQWAKGLNVCLPGHVVAYDAGTRRATVQAAVDMLTNDHVAIEAPLIPDVPVVWPATLRHAVVGRLVAGDPVLLVFSQRGLTGFKQSHARAMPDLDRLFSLSDAVALPGFGPTTITPATTTGIALQNVAGSEFIALEPGGIRIRTAGRVHLTDSQGSRNL